MCMTCSKEVNIGQLEAFKIFAKDEEGRLISAFTMARKDGLFYPANERIRVDDEETGFFAFKEFNRAVSLAIRGRRSWTNDFGTRYNWNWSTSQLIVLPVTMFEVYSEGKFRVPSGDPQCMDGYYPAYESKEIIVRDTPHNVNEFHDAVISRVVKDRELFWTPVEKQAFFSRLPQYMPKKKAG